MSCLRSEIALNQLRSARDYLHSLIDDLQAEDWFWTPIGQPENAFATHIAWQVGHIAMAEYGLMLFRQRGRADVDFDLMPSKFRKTFAKGSVATGERSDYPSPAEILAQLSKIHQQVLLEVPNFSESDLDQALDPPHAAYATRFGAMIMAAHHEMLHCGQIGMLRRMMGKPPVR